MDPKGPVDQLLHPRYRLPAQRKKAVLVAILGLKPSGEAQSIYAQLLSILRDRLSDKFFESDRIKAFISRSDKFRPSESEPPPEVRNASKRLLRSKT
ncbi:MAG: hypothetical protein COV44_11250 [Deltaproteobacteria bacterium CG11_big_fil_rev_8_21_14_0_20_45_16]|nr:MAG: hypothetical protein COV44_11250 [Deltaproteobacteria bacterium CG11_big_fil_rev_8_21_14_0_20_45_16]